MRFGSKICKTLLKDTGMTMRILNMITFSVIAIPQPQQQLTDSKRAKAGRLWMRRRGSMGNLEWKKEPQRRTPCHYYNRVVYPWVIFFSATALEIKWTFPRTRPHTHHHGRRRILLGLCHRRRIPCSYSDIQIDSPVGACWLGQVLWRYVVGITTNGNRFRTKWRTYKFNI